MKLSFWQPTHLLSACKPLQSRVSLLEQLAVHTNINVWKCWYRATEPELICVCAEGMLRKTRRGWRKDWRWIISDVISSSPPIRSDPDPLRWASCKHMNPFISRSAVMWKLLTKSVVSHVSCKSGSVRPAWFPSQEQRRPGRTGLVGPASSAAF